MVGYPFFRWSRTSSLPSPGRMKSQLQPLCKRCETQFFSSDGQGKVLSGLSWRRNSAELFQQTDSIRVLPNFGDFAHERSDTCCKFTHLQAVLCS